jgi:hypothetical protein
MVDLLALGIDVAFDRTIPRHDLRRGLPAPGAILSRRLCLRLPDAYAPCPRGYLKVGVVARKLDEGPGQTSSDEHGADVGNADSRALGNQPAILVNLMPDTTDRLAFDH